MTDSTPIAKPSRRLATPGQRASLHLLVDTLPDDDLDEAVRLLTWLADPERRAIVAELTQALQDSKRVPDTAAPRHLWLVTD